MIQDPTFWFLIAFVTFFALIGKTLWKIATTALDERTSKIENTIADAIDAREQARNLLASIKVEYENAQTHAQKIIENAELESAQLKAKAEEEINEFLQRREKQSEQRIKTIEHLALEEIKKQAIEAGVKTATKILSEKVDEKAEEQILQQALAGLREQKFRG